MTSLCFSLCMLLPFISLTRQSFFKKITATAYHSHNVILNSFDLVSKIEKNSNTFFFWHLQAKYECTSVSALCPCY